MQGGSATQKLCTTYHVANELTQKSELGYQPKFAGGSNKDGKKKS